MRDIAKLNAIYPNKKVVFTLATDIRVKELLAAQGGRASTDLGEQANALKTINQGANFPLGIW